MEEALFLKHRDKKPENVGELITANNDSLIAVAINEYKRQVPVEYQGDWTHFFLEWRAKQEKFQTKLFEEIRKNKQRVKQESRKIAHQYQNLYNQYLENQQKVEDVDQESLHLQ